MRRTSRAIPFVVAIGLLLTGLMAGPAEAAKRKVPFGFFGVTMIGELTSKTFLPDAKLDEQMALMASSGVESTRIGMSTGGVEPARGVYTWAPLDRLVAAAARHHIAVLVNISTSAPWSSSKPNSPEFWRYPPKDPKDFAELMRQAVLRYGPKGSFWVQNPGIPKVPVHKWQVWNEQMAPWFWVPRPWAPRYVKLLKASYKAIHRADKKATVIAGSLMSYGPYHQWDSMRLMYRAGAKKYFDEVAVHPFTNDASARVTANQTIEIIRRVRAEMRKRHDTRKGIEVTEMTWAAAKGIVPQNAMFGMETTAKGQAARLKASYGRLMHYRKQMRITGVYWFTWATDYLTGGNPSSMSFRFAGLVRYDRGTFIPMPLLGTYQSLAAKNEGCRKSSSARTCLR